MDELFKLIGLGTPFVYAGATYAFFHWLDVNASDEAKEAISRLLKLNTVDGLVVAGGRPIIALILCSLIGVFIAVPNIAIRLHFVDYPEFWLSKWDNPIMLVLALPPALLVFAWLPLFGVSLSAIRMLNLLLPVVTRVQWAIKECREHPLIAATLALTVAAHQWRHRNNDDRD
jgi:hypothetical protein